MIINMCARFAPICITSHKVGNVKKLATSKDAKSQMEGKTFAYTVEDISLQIIFFSLIY